MPSTGVSRIEGVDPSVAIKAPCLVATTTNITLSGAQTIDGVAVAETTPLTRVLVRAQTDSTENGIYDVSGSAWTRAEDFDGNRDVVKGTLVSVTDGTTYSGSTFKVTTANPVVINTSSIVFDAANAIDVITVVGTSGVDTYAKMRALPSGLFSPGDIIKCTGDGIFGDFKVKDATVTDNGGTIIVANDNPNRYYERIYDYVTLGYFGADETGANDSTPALTALAAAFPSGGISVKIKDTVRITAGNVELPGNIMFFGDGIGVSKLEMHQTSNPASDTYIGRFTDVNNITFKDLTLTCTAAAEGIFNLGSLSGGVYGPDQAGTQYAFRIAGCENVYFERVEVVGFSGESPILFTNTDGQFNWNRNVNITDCYGHDNRGTGFSLQAVDGFTITGGHYENNGWETFDSVDANGNPTSTTRTTTNYIDGGTGYGIVLGRSTSATKLKSINGICKGVRTSKNKRHGIDAHSAANVRIVDCHSTDDLLTGFGVQGSATSLDNTVGDITISGGSISQTVYSENRGFLFDDRSSGVERDDSNPIFVANTASEFKNVSVDGVVISGWRYRQISSYSATDTIMAITLSANDSVEVQDITILADNADFYPSKIIQATSRSVIVSNNNFEYGIRGTFDRAAFRFESTVNNTRLTDNTIREINVYSTGTTQAQRSVFEKTGSTDKPVFSANQITRSTQGTRGSLCETTSGNAQWGYRGFWGVNQGNVLDGEVYAGKIDSNKTFHISIAGAGNQDGSSAANAFAANNAANLQLIADQLPEVTEDVNLTLQFEDGAYTLVGTITIPYDGWQLLGNAAEFGAATTKSVDMDNGAACDLNFQFPKYGRRSTIKGIQVRSANGLTVRNANIVQGCVIENSGSGAGFDYGAYKETGECFVDSNYFTGGYAAIAVYENASVISRVNDDTGTQPIYGLEVNGGIIMKNSTQPTGSTANELAANGGVIR